MNALDYVLGCDLMIGVGVPSTKYADAATVLAVQKALKALGKPSLDPKKIDGLWGSDTAAAVRALKAEGNQTDLDGGIDDWTLRALGVSQASMLPSFVITDKPSATATATPIVDRPRPEVQTQTTPSFWGQSLWAGGPARWQGALGAFAALFVTGGVIALARR